MSSNFDYEKASYAGCKYDQYGIKAYYDFLRQRIPLEEYELIIEQAENAGISLSKYILDDRIITKKTKSVMKPVFISPNCDLLYDYRYICSSGVRARGMYDGTLVMGKDELPCVRYNLLQEHEFDMYCPESKEDNSEAWEEYHRKESNFHDVPTVLTQQEGFFNYRGFPQDALVLIKGQPDLAYSLARAKIDVAVGDFYSIYDYNTLALYDAIYTRFLEEDEKFKNQDSNLNRYLNFETEYYHRKDEKTGRALSLVYRYNTRFRKR